MTAPEYNAGYNNSWALIIGINGYKNAPRLEYARNDADSIAKILTSSLGFSSSQIVVLQDQAATKDKILENYLEFHDKAKDPNDRVLVFFAGHGHTIRSSREAVGYLVPADGDPNALHTLIRWDDLTRNADLIQAKHILFIMDACYSGLAMQRVSAPAGQRFLTDMLQRPARQVITAGKADETVADGGGPTGKNSIFTGYLIEGLSGKAASQAGILTANNLMHYVYEKVGQDPRSRQTPHYGHIDGDGDFVLLSPDLQHLKSAGFSDVLVDEMEEHPEPSLSTASAFRPSFAKTLGYNNPGHSNFGRNDLSSRLGEDRRSPSTLEIAKAFSWLSVIIEPADTQSVSLEMAKLVDTLRRSYGNGAQPYEKFQFPLNERTNLDSLIIYDEWNDPKLLSRYLRITDHGQIECAESKNVFLEYEGKRFFRFVQIVGSIWQTMILCKRILSEHKYNGRVHLTVAMVGTRDTILGDFSREAGKDNQHWRDPMIESFYFDKLSTLACTDPNLKMEYAFSIGNLGENESLGILKSIAKKLSLAYNHKSQPRCFNFDTDVFPWNQFFSAR